MRNSLPIGLATLSLLFGSGCSTLTAEKRIRKPIQTDYSVHSSQFRNSLGELTGAPLVEGNNVVELLNGDKIFGSMLEAIRSAQKNVNIEMYIWSSGKISDQFVAAVCERAQAGVKVRIIKDGVGSMKLKGRDITKMVKAGVQVGTYHPPGSIRIFHTNYRTHRKLTIVDGQIGFIGGVCINDDWQGNAEPGHWRDTHLRVEGPVVEQIQAIFADNWLQVRSEVLHGEDYFPEPKKAGNMVAQCVKSGPREGAEKTRMTYLMSIAAARKNIRIAHAYFAPDTLMIDTLIAAIKRGVDVQIIVPGKSDNMPVVRASRPRWQRLLEAGAKFYRYEPTLYHCKIMIVDDVWSIVGSVNFDERSFRLNDEANLDVYDKDFAATLIRSFEEDKSKSKLYTLEEQNDRNFFDRWMDHFAGLFRAQL